MFLVATCEGRFRLLAAKCWRRFIATRGGTPAAARQAPDTISREWKSTPRSPRAAQKGWCRGDGRVAWRVVGRWAKIWGVVWLTGASLLAAPFFDEPVATLTLRDGTVLRDARAKGFLTKVVLVRHEGGVRTVAYEQFPDEFQAALAAKRQAVLAAAQTGQKRLGTEAPAQAQAAPPAANAAPPAAPEPAPSQEIRLTVTSCLDDVVLLKIENVSDHVVTLLPAQFLARTADGEEYSGASWVGIHKDHLVAKGWASQRSIDPGATVSLALVLTGASKLQDGSIETVTWKKP